MDSNLFSDLFASFPVISGYNFKSKDWKKTLTFDKKIEGLILIEMTEFWALSRPEGKIHSVKSVRIWSYSGPYFTAFELNTERYGASFRI